MWMTQVRPTLGALTLAALAPLSACSKDPAPPAATGGAKAAVAGATAATGATGATAAMPAVCTEAKTHVTGTIAWIVDDYAKARACAEARGLPLVLDLWAPWCHTCLSMQHTVFTEASLGEMANRFVFAALDTDREVNAPALTTFPVASWPTFYVVSPGDQAVQARFVGGATLDQFREFLRDGERGTLAAKDGRGELRDDDPDHVLRMADRAIAQKDAASAAQLYAKAITLAPATWPRRADTLVNLVQTLAKQQAHDECLAVVERALPTLAASSSRTDFLVFAQICAKAVAETKPEVAAHVHARALGSLEALLADPAAVLSVDDRSDALLNVRELQTTLGQADLARATAGKQRALLDQAFASAPMPEAAMTYIWPMAEVYVYLEAGRELAPRLEALAQKLPEAYDPPHRLAWTLWKSGDAAAAMPWAEKAAALAYGPRKARAQAQAADIALAVGDREKARTFYEAQRATLVALPAPGATPEQLAAVDEKLAGLTAPTPPAR